MHIKTGKQTIRVLIFAAVPVFILLSITFVSAQEGEGTPRSGIRPDAPPYGVRGLYSVGTKEFVIEDNQGTLMGTVWYPALNPDNTEELNVYAYDMGPDMPPLTIEGHAILDAAINGEQGPYPLVIYSHGLGGSRWSSLYLTEHLASYGFIVMAVDHSGDNFLLENTPEMIIDSYATRPNDVRRLIAYADSLVLPGGQFEGALDVQIIGLTGVSFGGYTTVASAGARFNFGGLAAWCAENAGTALDPDPSAVAVPYPILPFSTAGACFIGQHQERLAELRGLESFPEGLWESFSDPRVAAAVPIVPWNAPLFNEAGLAALTVPVMVIDGTADVITPPERDAYRFFEYFGSDNKVLVMLENAGHLSVLNDCSAWPWLGAMAYSFCSDPVWDMDRAHDLINHFTTAFLLATLKGDTDAAAALAPDVVSFPGITYETTGF